MCPSCREPLTEGHQCPVGPAAATYYALERQAYLDLHPEVRPST